jgi:hypothetical protein
VADIREAPSVSASSKRQGARITSLTVGTLIGLLVVGGSTWAEPLQASGWQALGPLLGIVMIVCSLFGDLPPSVAWLQRLGSFVYPGVALGTVLLLIPFVLPSKGHESSVVAFSPNVWAAYISIVLVGISFETSDLPHRIYRFCRKLPVGPAVVIPIYIIAMGLSGNILDGVSIMAISVVIFLSLLPLVWALRASFALLFGGLIANLVTVAAEPTNIKFQDVLHSLLDRISPPYWFTNWPISVLGILAPALLLALAMWYSGATWREDPASAFAETVSREGLRLVLSMLAIVLLAVGIIAHAVVLAHGASTTAGFDAPLWIFLLPAGVLAVLHLLVIHRGPSAVDHISQELPIWGKLMVIFSLLWFLGNAVSGTRDVFAPFFQWPEPLRYGMMVLLSLASSITDNVALAAMQGSILIAHPLTIWQIRLLFILLTWAGGFTPFGCLQSLTTNSRLNLSTGAWFRETLPWAVAAILGGLTGLVLLGLLYPSAVGPVR